MSTAADDPESQLRLVAFVQGQAGRLDRRPKPTDRHPLGIRRYRARSQVHGGIARTLARRHCGGRTCRVDRAGDSPHRPRHADRVRAGSRPGRSRLHRELGAHPGGNVTGFAVAEFSMYGKYRRARRARMAAGEGAGRCSITARAHFLPQPMRIRPGRAYLKAPSGYGPARHAAPFYTFQSRVRHGVSRRIKFYQDRLFPFQLLF
jgi:hypothetical protein